MNDKIRFNYAPEAHIEAQNGSTSFSDLFIVGAMALSAKSVCPGRMGFSQYPTDREGLKLTSMKADELLDALHDAIKVIGVLMAYAGPEEIAEEFQTISWLIAGLGELSGMVARASDEMDHALSSDHELKKFSEKEFSTAINEKVKFLTESINTLNSEPMSSRNLSFVLNDAENIAHLTMAAMDSGVKRGEK